MLALFSLLGTFFSLLATSCACLALLGRFFGVLERAGLDCRWVREGPGRVLEVLRPYLSRFFPAQELAIRNSSGCAKATIFLMFFLGFYYIARVADRHKNDEKSLREAFAWTFSQRTCQNLVLDIPGLDLGGVWVPSGPPLAVTWALMSGSWASLGASWVALGRLLGALGRLLAALWPSWTPLGSIWGGFGRVRARFWRALGAGFAMLLALLAVLHLLLVPPPT